MNVRHQVSLPPWILQILSLVNVVAVVVSVALLHVKRDLVLLIFYWW